MTKKRPSIASFTNVGYHLRARGRAPEAWDLSGRAIVVTGATSGLGLAAARELGALGAELILVGRNGNRLNRAAASIAGRASGQARSRIRTEIADLSLVSDTRNLGERLLRDVPRIHALVNNAGALFTDRTETAEGIERTLATNLLSQFVLTNTLIPRLVESAPARIVNVSSGGMYSQRLDPNDLQTRGPYRGAAAYARTKRGQVVLTEMWAKRLHGSGVVIHAMHPGWTLTPGLKGSLPRFSRLMRPLLRTPRQGADTIVWLVAANEPAMSSGDFWLDRVRQPTHLWDRTRESVRDREALWSGLEHLASGVPA